MNQHLKREEESTLDKHKKTSFIVIVFEKSGLQSKPSKRLTKNVISGGFYSLKLL